MVTPADRDIKAKRCPRITNAQRRGMFATVSYQLRAASEMAEARDEDEAEFVCGMRLRLDAGRDPFVTFDWGDYLPSHHDNTLPGGIIPGAGSTHNVWRTWRPHDHRPAAQQLLYECRQRARRAEIDRIADEEWAAAERAMAKRRAKEDGRGL